MEQNPAALSTARRRHNTVEISSSVSLIKYSPWRFSNSYLVENLGHEKQPMLFQAATSGGSCNCSGFCSHFSHRHPLQPLSPVTFSTCPPVFGADLLPHIQQLCLEKEETSLESPHDPRSYSLKLKSQQYVSSMSGLCQYPSFDLSFVYFIT